MAIRICPKCGGKVSTSRETCSHCGHIFGVKILCPECEKEVDINTVECPVCGYEFIHDKNSKIVIEKRNNRKKKVAHILLWGFLGFTAFAYLINAIIALCLSGKLSWMFEYIQYGYIAGFICMGVGVAGFITMLIILFRNKNIVAMKTRVISILLMTVLLFITFAPLIFYDPLKYQKQEDGTYSIVGCYPSADRVKIPATYGGSPVTKIEDNGFACCNKLTSVTIPNSITSIGAKAFYWCPNLQSVILPGSITSIGKEAFAHCYSLSSITIPNGVTTIGERAFEHSGLISIDLPDSVTSIGDFAFSGVTNLTSIVIPDGVTSIGAYVFEHCYSLESVILPGSITSIDGVAFSCCINLTSIIIPSSVTTLGDGVFAGCSNLKTIKYCGTEEQWLAITKEGDWDWCFGDDYMIIYEYAGE